MDLFTHFFEYWIGVSYAIFPNWGVSIILVTVVFRAALAPLLIYSTLQQQRLNRLKPQLDKLASKFKNDFAMGLRARRDLLRSEGVHSGRMFAVMILPLPVFVAFYSTIRKCSFLHGAGFLWIADLSSRDPFLILPVLIAVVAFWSARMSKEEETESSKLHASLPYALPLVQLAMMATLPAAVALYSLTGSAMQLAVQRFTQHHFG